METLNITYQSAHDTTPVSKTVELPKGEESWPIPKYIGVDGEETNIYRKTLCNYSLILQDYNWGGFLLPNFVQWDAFVAGSNMLANITLTVELPEFYVAIYNEEGIDSMLEQIPMIAVDLDGNLIFDDLPTTMLEWYEGAWINNEECFFTDDDPSDDNTIVLGFENRLDFDVIDFEWSGTSFEVEPEYEYGTYTLTEDDLPALTTAGYIFKGWTVNGTDILSVGDTLENDAVFVAVWTMLKYMDKEGSNYFAQCVKKYVDDKNSELLASGGIGYTENETIHPIDSKYLPDTVASKTYVNEQLSSYISATIIDNVLVVASNVPTTILEEEE